jgi:hypothetical protein
MKHALLTILVVLGFSCSSPWKEEPDAVQVAVDSTSLYGSKSFVMPEIRREYADFLSEWSIFPDFSREMKSLNMQPLPVVKNKSEALVKHTDSLIQKIPAPLYTNPIFARLRVVNMRAKLLQQEAQRPRIDSAALQKAIVEMNLAASHLVVQINEKFAKEAIDHSQEEIESRELKQQQRFLDSVYRSELRDKNRDSL